MAVLWTHVASVVSWVCEPASPDSACDNAVNDQILQLQSALDETRLLLNHEQQVSQDERRRREMLQREMQDKLELQDHEMKRLLAELETAKEALHQKKNEFHKPLEETSEKPSKVHSHVLKQFQYMTVHLTLTTRVRDGAVGSCHLCSTMPRSRRLPAPP